MSLELMLDRLNFIKALPEREPGLYLHLGCGPQILSGWTNIDGYHMHPHITKLDISEPLPFPERSVNAIYSSHSLEHLPNRKALASITDWSKLLVRGGKVFLAVPDLAEICRIMLDPKVSDDLKYGWYIYTLFGYQTDTSISWHDKSLNLPVWQGQFHTTGFTTDRLRSIFVEREMVIREIFTYDGYGTPSIFCEAEKI